MENNLFKKFKMSIQNLDIHLISLCTNIPIDLHKTLLHSRLCHRHHFQKKKKYLISINYILGEIEFYKEYKV
jgi:hypothetical protein